MTNLCRAHVYVWCTCGYMQSALHCTRQRVWSKPGGIPGGAWAWSESAVESSSVPPVECVLLLPRVFHLNVCSLSVFVPVLNARLANVKLTPRVHG